MVFYKIYEQIKQGTWIKIIGNWPNAVLPIPIVYKLDEKEIKMENGLEMCIIAHIARSSKGRTADSDPANLGSIPSLAANKS